MPTSRSALRLAAALTLTLAGPVAAEPAGGQGPDALPAALSPAEPPALPPDRTWVVPTLRLTPPDLAAIPTRPSARAPLLAAGNALGANVLIWSFSKFVTRQDWADISVASMKDNLNGPWVFDPNNYVTNQFAHPYQGSISFTAARAAGLGFWEAAPYPVVMSTLWELFAETEKPAINDAITTPVAGAFLGEALFRVAGLVLDGGGERPGVTRELAAAAVSPMVGLTRLEAGGRYRARAEEVIPVHVELSATGSFSGRATSDGVTRQTGGLAGVSAHVMHGLPVPGWSPRRPFDHFDLQAGVSVASTPFFNLAVRGLLLGDDFGGAEERLGRGFWGLWGIYEAFSPQVFRTSTSALGLGAVRQWAWPSGLALAVTGLAGAGFGAAGGDRVSEDARDYHYGLNTLALVEARLHAADRGSLSVAVRQYFIGGLVSEDSAGSEALSRLSVGARLRVHGPHAVGLDVVAGLREATFGDRPDASARFSQATASYVYAPGRSLGSGLRVQE